MEIKKGPDFKYKLCVSGAAETGHCGDDSFKKAQELGREIIRQNGILVNGATTGFPLHSAMGAKDVGGMTIGLSPASTEREHLDSYKLPLDYLDVIIYTGFGFSGRNLLLTRSSDAVFIGCGRIGTINEFTVSYEDGKPIGVLEGDWETDEVIKNMMEKSHRVNPNVVFDRDPKILVEKVIALINEMRKVSSPVYKNTDVLEDEDEKKFIL